MSISLVSVYPVKINLSLIDNAEIRNIEKLDYLFQAQDTVKYTFANLDTALDTMNFINYSDLPEDSNIRLYISPSDHYSNDISIDSMLNLVIKEKIESDYDIHLDSLKENIINSTNTYLQNTNLQSFVDEPLLVTYKLSAKHLSTNFLSTFGDLTLDYPEQENLEILFGIIYNLVN